MARFLLVNQFYWPDFASTGQHLTDLAEHLVRQGHEVRVLCSRGRDSKADLATSLREEREGVDVQRVRSSNFGRRLAAGRMTDYLSFHLLAGPRIALSRWADVVVTLTSPPLLGVWGAAAKRLGGPKHVVFLMDHHPDAEFELGMLKRTSLLGRLLEDAYTWVLRSADHLGVLGYYMGVRARQRGVPVDRISVIPIWSRSDEIAPVPHDENPLRARFGWEDKFVVLYSGNAGLVHRFDELCGAMKQLSDRAPDVRFVFIGGGPRLAEIKSFADKERLTNAEFLPYFSREDLKYSLSAANAHFLSLRDEHVGVSVPGKLYGQLASGRPVLFVGPQQCESAEDVHSSGGGFCFRPGESEALADAIMQLRNDAGLAREMGASGRAWFSEFRERLRSCEMWRLMLEDVAAGRPVSQSRLALAGTPALRMLERAA